MDGMEWWGFFLVFFKLLMREGGRGGEKEERGGGRKVEGDGCLRYRIVYCGCYVYFDIYKTRPGFKINSRRYQAKWQPW